MSAQIQLTDAELNLIEANRQAAVAEEAKNKALKAKIAAERAVKDAAEEKARLESRRKHIIAENSMVEKLLVADTSNVFSVTYSTVDGISDVAEPKVTFEINGRTEDVIISEIVKTSGRYSFRVHHTGEYQYSVSGSYTDWKTRNYKNAKSLVKKVVEFKEIATAVADRKAREKDLAKVTLAELKKQHPTADVKISEPNSWSSLSSKYYHTFHVTTTAGTVSFTSHYKEDKLVIVVFAFEPKSTEVKAEIANLILAG